MQSPSGNDKAEELEAQKQALLNLKRTYTTGGRIGARQMFVFNEDGTIAGLKKVEPSDLKRQDTAPVGDTKKTSVDGSQKFGKVSSQMSVSAMSYGGESKVAFSDANYMPQEG